MVRSWDLQIKVPDSVGDLKKKNHIRRSIECQFTSQQAVANSINLAEFLSVKSTVKFALAPSINSIVTFPKTLGSSAKEMFKL